MFMRGKKSFLAFAARVASAPKKVFNLRNTK